MQKVACARLDHPLRTSAQKILVLNVKEIFVKVVILLIDVLSLDGTSCGLTENRCGNCTKRRGLTTTVVP